MNKEHKIRFQVIPVTCTLAEKGTTKEIIKNTRIESDRIIGVFLGAGFHFTPNANNYTNLAASAFANNVCFTEFDELRINDNTIIPANFKTFPLFADGGYSLYKRSYAELMVSFDEKGAGSEIYFKYTDVAAPYVDVYPYTFYLILVYTIK